MAMTETTNFLFAFQSDISGLQKMKQAQTVAEKHLASFGKSGVKVEKIVSASMKRMGDGSVKFGVKFKDSLGRVHSTMDQVGKGAKKGEVNVKRLESSLKNMAKGADKASASTKKIASATSGVTNAVKKGTRASLDFTKALKRVAIVVPLWTAYRMVMRQVNDTIRDGIKHIVDYDKAIRRAMTVTNASEQTESFTRSLREQSEALSELTGESIGDTIEAYYQFATAGASAEESLAGQEATMRLSVATMSDAKTTAKLLNTLYLKFGKSIDKVTGTTKKYNYIAGSLNKLFKSNRFEMNEFQKSVENGASIGETFNLTFEEVVSTLAVLNTAGGKAGKAGTALTQILVKLATNGEKLKKGFDGAFDGIDLDNRDLYKEMLLLIDYVNDSSNSIERLSEVVGEGIVTLKGVKNVGALRSVIEKLKNETQELQEINAKGLDDQLQKDFEEQNASFERSLKRLEIIKSKIGKAFVTSVIGGNKDFGEAIDEIGRSLKNLEPVIQDIGLIINKLLVEPLKLVALTLEALENLKPDSKGGERREQKSNLRRTSGYREALAGGSSVEETENLIQLLKDFKKYGSDARPEAQKFGQAIEGLGYSAENSIDALENVIKKKKELAEGEDFKLVNIGEIVVSKDEADNANNKADAKKRYVEYQKEDFQNLQSMVALGYTQIEIEQTKLEMLKQQRKSKENDLEIEEQILKIKKMQTEEINKSSQALQSQVSSGLSEVIQGKQDFGDLASNLGGFYQKSSADALAKGLTSNLFKNTGIGQIFGEQMQGLESMFNTPMENQTSDLIEANSKNTDRIVNALTGTGGENMASSIASAFGGGKGRGSTQGGISGLLGSLMRGRQVGTRTVGGKQVPIFQNETADGVGGIGGWLNNFAGTKFGGALGGIASKAGMISGYAQILGMFSDARGTDQGAFTSSRGTRLGANRNAQYQYAGIALAPEVRSGWSKKDQLSQTVGYYMDPLGLMKQSGNSKWLLGMPWLKKGWGKDQDGERVVDEQSVTELKNVTSAVQSVQKEVGWVNRNLVDLKQTMVYIMQESSYFSENSAIVENFAINASRGR